ncbi:MAG: hypothetical protein ABH812_03450 [bacterium]
MINFIKDFLKTILNLLRAMGDFVVLVLPQMRKMEGFAFLVHPRDISDICRPYPVFKYLPDKVVLWLVRFLPPITLSRITGIKSVNNGHDIQGWLLSIVLTPDHIKTDLPLVKKRIKQLSVLAQRKGCSLIGLGALLPFLTRYGKDLEEFTKCKITTGHAYTVAAIVKDVYITVEALGIPLENCTVAIIGAGGSVGSLCAKTLSKTNGISRLLLVDLMNKQNKLEFLKSNMEIESNIKVEIGYDLNLLINADIAIVVTNATRTIIEAQMLKRGAIIIDDSQPRNTSSNLTIVRPDILIVDVLGSYPNLNCHFNFGLLEDRPDISYTCLIETAILAAHDWKENFCIGADLDVDKVKLILDMGNRIGVESEKVILTSFSKIISVGDILNNKCARGKCAYDSFLS